MVEALNWIANMVDLLFGYRSTWRIMILGEIWSTGGSNMTTNWQVYKTAPATLASTSVFFVNKQHDDHFVN